jgi:hypothetical protein
MKISLSDYLKATDVKQGDLLKILDEGELKESQFKDDEGNPKMQYVFKVEVNGDNKLLTINKTSLKNLANKWSSETTLWIGQSAVINIGMTPNGKKMLILTPKE